MRSAATDSLHLACTMGRILLRRRNHDRCNFDHGNPFLTVDPDPPSGRWREIDDSAFNIRTSVADGDPRGAPVLEIGYQGFCSERQRLACSIVAVRAHWRAVRHGSAGKLVGVKRCFADARAAAAIQFGRKRGPLLGCLRKSGFDVVHSRAQTEAKDQNQINPAPVSLAPRASWRTSPRQLARLNMFHAQPNLLVGSFLSIHLAGLVPVGTAALLTAAAVALTLILLPGLSALATLILLPRLSALGALILLPRLSALGALILLAGTFLAALVLLPSALALTLVILIGRHVDIPPMIELAMAR